MSCKGLTGKALADCKKKNKPTYKNFAMANQARNKSEGLPFNRPATKRDSAQYVSGFRKGLKGYKPSKMRLRYEGETEFQKMGRWEGQNVKKNK